jgi:hypothetical protein
LQRPKNDLKVGIAQNSCDSRRWISRERLPGDVLYSGAGALLQRSKNQLEIGIAQNPCDRGQRASRQRLPGDVLYPGMTDLRRLVQKEYQPAT